MSRKIELWQNFKWPNIYVIGVPEGLWIQKYHLKE